MESHDLCSRFCCLGKYNLNKAVKGEGTNGLDKPILAFIAQDHIKIIQISVECPLEGLGRSAFVFNTVFREDGSVLFSNYKIKSWPRFQIFGGTKPFA